MTNSAADQSHKQNQLTGGDRRECRLAAAAARKRAPVSAAPLRDTSTPLAERIGIQLDLAWTSEYNGLINGEIDDKTTAAI